MAHVCKVVLFLMAMAGSAPAMADSLLLCGADEVFLFDVAAAGDGKIPEQVEKRWSWKAKDHVELPEAVRKRFGTTDDCKPLDDGRRVLISSSGGGCALVERSRGQVLWYAEVPNAHSLEMLPRQRIVVASSVSSQGNRLILFNVADSNRVVWETPLESAHGVVWDESRHRLWALGLKELRSYELKDWESDKPSLALEASYPLPDENGHDLQAIPHGKDLSVSTGKHVYLFDRDQRQCRLHPELGDRANVKSVSVHPTSGRTAFIQGQGQAWWSERLGLLAPTGEILLRGEHLYKGRWIPTPAVEAQVAVERLSRFAAGSSKTAEHRLVFVYFTPNDREPPADCRQRLARVMTDVQEFYAREMERHGLGRRSIRFDLNADGALVVHHVKGPHPTAYYLGRDSAKGREIRQVSRPVLAAAGVDDERETVIYFCHMRTEQGERVSGIGPYYGTGARDGAFRSGHCWFTDASILDPGRLGDRTSMLNDEEYGRISVGRYNSVFIGGAAHELGHGLGLPHSKERADERTRGVSLMGSGNRTYGEERRGEGRGSMLTLADALRLASHPIFSGTDRDLNTRPESRLDDLRVSVSHGVLELSGRLIATPEPYALMAYNDPEGHSDYDATTWTATLDADNRFVLRVAEFKPGHAELRLIVCHVNGANSVFRYPLTVGSDGTPDAAMITAERP